MKKLSVREMRANIGRLDELVEEAGELVISRRGKPIARVLPAATAAATRSRRSAPAHGAVDHALGRTHSRRAR